MAVFFVGYDLKKPGQFYKPLIEALEKVGRPILRSDWIVDVNQTARQLREAIKSYIDANDDVVVLEITTAADWACYTDRTNPGVQMLLALRP